MSHGEAASEEAMVHQVVQALVSGNPQDTFRARDYLKQNTNLAERVVGLLRQMKREKEATQIQQDFLGTNPPPPIYKSTSVVQQPQATVPDSTSMYNTQPAYQCQGASLATHQQYPPQPIQAAAPGHPQPIQHYGDPMAIRGMHTPTYPQQHQQQQMLQNRSLGTSPSPHHYPHSQTAGYVGGEASSMPHPQYYMPMANEQAYTPIAMSQHPQRPGVVPPAHYQSQGHAHTTVLNGLQYSYGEPPHPSNSNMYYHHT